MFKQIKKIPFLFFFLIGFNFVFSQNDLPAKPSLETSVYDNALILNFVQKKALEQKLIKYNDSTSTQIVVITVKTIHGKNIALYATELAHKWGIGQKGKDNGVLLLVAVEDRKLTIRSGYGVEYLLTDAYSRRIIEQVIKPEFKQGNYYSGIDKGVTYIMKALNGEFKGTPQHDTNGDNGMFVVFLFLFIIILIIILSNRNKGNRGGGFRTNSAGSLLETIILSNRGRGGFSGGGFGGSSGGFGGGFGGGGFGGGGASGSW